MKNSLRNITAFLMAAVLIAGSAFFAGCEKEEQAKPVKTSEFTIDQSKIGWVKWLIGGIVVVIGKVTEGQYYSTSTTSPDGTVTTTTGCKGLGSCAIKASVKDTGEPVNSLVWEETYDYSFEAILGVDQEGNILLILEEEKNPESFHRFFYADRITVSRPFIIDNKSIISEIGAKNVIKVQGDYPVFERTDEHGYYKYIVIGSAS